MVSKALISLFFAIFANLQVTNACFNDVLRSEFESLDKDANGVLNQDEACAPIINPYESVDQEKIDYCNMIWTSMDLNEDGKATCQELFIGSLALDESMEGELGNQLRIVFADKPDNCEEVAKEELKSLITAAGDGGSLEEFYKSVDANSDFIVTCNEILEYSFMMLNEIHNDEP